MTKVHPNLCFEFGPEVDGRREFIISADGDKKAFGAVQALAGAAPRLRKWEVIPFRPPKDLKKYPKVAYSNVELSSDDVWFSFQTEGSTIHLDLYIRGLSEENETEMGGLSFLLLDSALGEYVVETRIGGISRHPMPENADDLDLLPFPMITEVVRADVH